MMRVLDVCDGALGRCFVGSGSASTFTGMVESWAQRRAIGP